MAFHEVLTNLQAIVAGGNVQWRVPAGHLGIYGNLGLFHKQGHHLVLVVAAGVVEGIELIDIKMIKGGVPFVEVVLSQLFDLLLEVDSLVLFVEILHLVAVLLWLPIIV